MIIVIIILDPIIVINNIQIVRNAHYIVVDILCRCGTVVKDIIIVPVVNKEQTTRLYTACKVSNGSSVGTIWKYIKIIWLHRIDMLITFDFSDLLQSQASEQMSFLDI